MCFSSCELAALPGIRYVQMEGVIVLRRPVVRFRFGRELSFPIVQMRSDQIDLDEWPEHAGRDGPFEIVGSDHCGRRGRWFTTERGEERDRVAMLTLDGYFLLSVLRVRRDVYLNGHLTDGSIIVTNPFYLV